MKTKQNKQTKTNKQTNSNSNANTNANAESGTGLVKGLQNRSEQLSTETENAAEAGKASEKTAAPGSGIKPYVNFAERDFNRKLSVEQVLEKLQRWMPEQFKLAEIVGKWIWITFPEPPLERIRAELSQLGFHWNNTRKCWQHPCGETLPRGTQEPREKYGTWFANTHADFRKQRAEQAAAA